MTAATRLALLADVHGNLPALEAVLTDLAGERPDLVVVAGDVVNWGPFSAPVLERLAAIGAAVVRGNNELYLLDYGTPRALAEWRDLSQFPLLPWLQRQAGSRWRHAVAAWPDTLSLRLPTAPPTLVCHGAPASHWQGLYPAQPEAEAAALLAGVAERTLLVGHTHLPMCRQVGRWLVVNPGSVGLPLDGRPDAGYALLEGDAAGWRPTFRRVAYDRESLLREFERQGFVEECGVVGQLVVAEFETNRLQLLPFLRWRAERHPGEPVTPALLAEFGQAEILAYTPPAYRVPAEAPAGPAAKVSGEVAVREVAE